LQSLTRRLSALDDLQDMGVVVRLNSLVTDIQSSGITISEEFLAAKILSGLLVCVALM